MRAAALQHSKRRTAAKTAPTRRLQQERCRRCITRSHRLPVVATSEFWWEDEQEFDALTEVLLPKQVVLCTPPACQSHLQQLHPIKFVAAFCSPADKQEAEQLWEGLGRAGPPLFLKVRTRDTLQSVDQDGASSAADGFWREIAGQSWRMDLDYGLNKDATLQALTESLLVVVSSSSGLQQLLAAAVGDEQSSTSSRDGLCVVELTGWNQGAAQQQLQSWKQLQPRLVPLLEVAAVQQQQ